MFGALIGAAIAGGVALYTNYQNSQAAKEAKEEARAAAEALQAEYDKLTSSVNEHYARTPEEQAQADAAVNAYREKLANSNQEGFIDNFYDENGLRDKFEYDKDIADFMDPRAELLKEQVARKVMSSAAGGGMGRSYDGARAMGDAVVSKDEELYKNALTEFNTDRTQKYNEWNAYLQQKQNELTQLLTGQQNDLTNAKSLSDIYTSEDEKYWEDLMNSRIAGLNAGVQLQGMVNNTGNYTTDLGGMAALIGAGANVGDKVGAAFSGGSGSV